MKTPKKIYVYIPDDDIVGTASTQKGFSHQFVTEEYIRTDAFIEKAVDYIANNMRCDGNTLQTKVKFIRDFKKYMEGE